MRVSAATSFRGQQPRARTGQRTLAPQPDGAKHGVLVNENALTSAEHQASVPLRASHSCPIDITWALEALTDLDWFGAQVDGPPERTDLRRVSTDLELPIFDGSATGPIRKDALIDFGRPQARAGGILVEIAWQSASLAPLFPVFAGELRITPTSLLLDGRYVPPLGRLGLLIDEGILHVVARRTAGAFLARLATRFETSA